MKSARERAEEANRVAHASVDPVAAIERMFKEHARDQRHLCAERVQEAAASNAHPFVRDFANKAHHVAMNTPVPGERS